MKKIALSAAVFLIFVQINAYADIGRYLTKRERLERQQISGGRASQDEEQYEKIYESFLKENYTEVNRLAMRFSDNNPDRKRDVLYLQALSLVKLNQGDLARQKLRQLEQVSPTLNTKAQASASYADTFYYANDLKPAYDAYEATLMRYPNSDQNEYLRQRLSELQLHQTPASISTTLYQMGVEQAALYAVQVGSFTKQKNAEALVEKLKSAEYDAYVFKVPQDRMYRVRVGHLKSEKEAQMLESRLKKEGYPTNIYP